MHMNGIEAWVQNLFTKFVKFNFIDNTLWLGYVLKSYFLILSPLYVQMYGKNSYNIKLTLCLSATRKLVKCKHFKQNAKTLLFQTTANIPQLSCQIANSFRIQLQIGLSSHFLDLEPCTTWLNDDWDNIVMLFLLICSLTQLFKLSSIYSSLQTK